MSANPLPKFCSQVDGVMVCLMVLAITVVVQLGAIVVLVYFVVTRVPPAAPAPIVITAPAPTLPVPTSPVALAKPQAPVPPPEAAVSIQPPAPPIAPPVAVVTPPVMAAPKAVAPEPPPIPTAPPNAQALSQQLDAQITGTTLLDSAEQVCGYKAPESNETLTAFINQADSTAQQCQQACTGFLALQNEFGGTIKNGVDLPLARLPTAQQSDWQQQFEHYNQVLCQLRLPEAQALEDLKVQGGIIFGVGSPGIALLDFCTQLAALQALCPVHPDPI